MLADFEESSPKMAFDFSQSEDAIAERAMKAAQARKRTEMSGAANG